MSSENENAWITKAAIASVVMIIASLAFSSISTVSKVTSSICIYTADGCKSIIKKGANIPASYKEQFSNLEDYQKAVRISIFKGESKDITKNTHIDNLDLPITPLPAGQSKLEVEVHVNEYKVIQIFTKDLTSGAQQSFELGVLN